VAKEKKLTGRPRRNPDEVLGQLTIRLSSKLKFGLELLARAQHRSLSQAVEWALQAGLAHVKLPRRGDKDQDSLWTALEYAWEKPEGWQRTYVLFEFDPSLVTFEERHACSIIARSVEQMVVEHLRMDAPDRYFDIAPLWHQLVDYHWQQLIDDSAQSRISERLSTSNWSMLGALGVTKWMLQQMSPEQQIVEAHKRHVWFTDTTAPPP